MDEKPTCRYCLVLYCEYATHLWAAWMRSRALGEVSGPGWPERPGGGGGGDAGDRWWR